MRRAPPHAFVLLTLALMLGGCGEASRTEIIVAVDTDLAVPAELDAVRIDMVGPSGQLRRSMGFLMDETALPASVGMVHREGPLGPVQVTVTGAASGRDIIQRLAEVDFVEGETLVLFIALGRDCLDVSCPTGQTCDPLAAGCRAIEVGRDELMEWGGSVGRLDGGTPDGCVATSELCNLADDDCDGNVDEDFELSTDMTNCGACGTVCAMAPANGSSMCIGGACMLACDDTWADCNTDDMDGCETSLASAESCGGCTTACPSDRPFCQAAGSSFDCVATCSGTAIPCGDTCVDTDTDPLHCGDCETPCTPTPGSTPTCTGGTCGMMCDSGYGDCDVDISTGCETPLTTVTNCGACGNGCSLPNAIEGCVDGACAVTGCDPPFGDCDTTVANGCEADLASSATDCGICGSDCTGMPANGSRSCVVGMCRTLCDPGFGDCDMEEGNGCEEPTTTAARCGACAISCTDPGAPVCASDMGSYTCVASCSFTACPSGCTDTSANPLNCGMCGMACTSPPQAAATCMSGSCGFRCNTGYGDCNTMAADGCEATLSTVTDCGTCGMGCAPPNATGSCATGTCRVGSCSMGWLDCDTMAGNGCEASRSALTSCGGCGITCPTSGPNVVSGACMAGTCSLTCTAGFGNCDGMVANGCETPLDTATNCAACGAPCAPLHTTASCATGSCTLGACDTGWGDCDMNPATGCETDTTRARRHCGMCGMDCGAGNHCCGSVCQSGPC